MDLGGTWRATVADEDLRRSWLDLDDVDDWPAIEVPGHWRDQPGFDATDGPLLYRTAFDHDAPVGDERWWLRFDGVFYQGDVWLDGAYVGDTEGYFVPHAFEVTEALAERREHVLGIEVACSRPKDLRTKRAITGAFQHADHLDPSWNPGGIWRPVSLERTGPVRIRHLRTWCRDAVEASATVAFRAVLDAASSLDVALRSRVGDDERVEVRRLAAGENQVEWTMRIDEPPLWWPHALGDQPLLPVAVDVTPVDADTEAPIGEVSHRLERRIGLRQVHLKGWVLHVNGERLFLKGANLGPTDRSLGAVAPEQLRADVALARDAGLDLVRVHSHISRPELYDAADELGMVVWQDFPLHRGYARTIRKQAQRQAREAVDLLAHHPSLAIWCAHDEPYHVDGDGPSTEGSVRSPRFVLAQELPSWNRTILDRTVKRTIDKADGSRPVIAHSGVLPHPPQLDGTDSHLWFGWHEGDARDLPGLARAVPRLVRFVSEFGAQAVPDDVDFLEPERWPDLDWERLAAHHALARDAFARNVPPEDHPSFASWQRASQEHQAEVVRHHVEALRRLKYRPTGGFSVHLLADGQPAVSTALVDHRRTPKPAYEALREACRPVIVTADRLPAEVVAGQALAIDVHVVSDRRDPVEQLEVRAHLRWDGGGQRWRFGGAVGADAVARVGTLSIEVPDRPGLLELELELSGADVGERPHVRLDRSRIVAV